MMKWIRSLFRRFRPNIGIEVNVYAIARNVETGVETLHAGRNLLVDSGRDHVRDLIGGATTRADDMAVGTGAVAPVAGATALGAEVLRKQIQRRIDGTHSVEFQTLVLTSEANGNTLSEVGTFHNSTLIARTLISPTIAKTVSIEVTLAHVYTVNAV